MACNSKRRSSRRRRRRAATPIPSQVYPSEQAYLYALADAMHEEYKAIVDAGFVVQLDLGLPARNQVLPGRPAPSWEELREASEVHVEAYNHALRGIPGGPRALPPVLGQHEHAAHQRRAAARRSST